VLLVRGLLMSGHPHRVTETEAYYHALYHLVGHWAAYVAILGVLLTTALLLSLTPIPGDAHRRIATIGIVVTLALIAGLYFILRMKMYGDEVATRLPESYKRRLKNLQHHNRSMVFGIGGVVGLAFLNWWLLYELWR
jgi:heme/copper-type cytochrome/quinol oxidase subunit 1